MRALSQFSGKSVARDPVSYTARLTLYDQYGAMAYGVITQIIPEPDIAQTVLIDLFASLQVTSLPDSPTRIAGAIVRLARTKALEAKPVELPVSTGFNFSSIPTDNLPKLVFDLTFNRGFKLETVADQLEMTYLDVLKALRNYVDSIRTR